MVLEQTCGRESEQLINALSLSQYVREGELWEGGVGGGTGLLGIRL